jgi:hypothetical protein
LYYGFWGSCLNDYRDTAPHSGYALIKGWKEKYFSAAPQAGRMRRAWAEELVRELQTVHERKVQDDDLQVIIRAPGTSRSDK